MQPGTKFQLQIPSASCKQHTGGLRQNGVTNVIPYQSSVSASWLWMQYEELFQSPAVRTSQYPETMSHSKPFLDFASVLSQQQEKKETNNNHSTILIKETKEN